MAEPGDGGRRGGSGTAGGTDVEPLRGGMHEVERGARETESRQEPAAPYHETGVQEGGLAPRDAGASGAASQRGSAPPQRAPGKAGGEVRREAGGKLGEERGDHENEAGNAPREDPGAKGAGERR